MNDVNAAAIYIPDTIEANTQYQEVETVRGGDLSSHFVEVKLKGLIRGEVYSVKDTAEKILDITNIGEDTIDITVEPKAPDDYNLVPGYEPIPDISWVSVEKDHFEGVGPGESVETDIFISIPDDKEYAGKRYQIDIYSYTAGMKTPRAGITGRILIEVADF